MIRSNFPSGFPDGLLQPLPASLLSIQFCVTDLASLPGDLPSRWHQMAVVAFEYAELAEFPASLLALQVYSLSFKGNKLDTVPQLAEMPPGIFLPDLSLNENPLKELPAALSSPTSFLIAWIYKRQICLRCPYGQRRRSSERSTCMTPRIARTLCQNFVNAMCSARHDPLLTSIWTSP